MQLGLAAAPSAQTYQHTHCERKLCTMSMAHPVQSDDGCGDHCPFMQQSEPLSLASHDDVPDTGLFTTSLLTQALLVVGAPGPASNPSLSLTVSPVSTVVLRQ
jgi:hypothetical protein